MFLRTLTVLAVALASLTSCQSAAKPERQSAAAADPPPAVKTETAPAQTQSGSAQLPANAPVIVTFGDSLTAGVAGRSYPDQLEDLLLQNGYHYRVDNQGVSGDTTVDGLARIDNVIAAHPALVLLEFGGNDGLRGTPVSSIKHNLQTLIDRLRGAHIPVALLGITLPPNYGPDYVQPFTALYPDLAKQYKLPVFPFLLVHVYQDSSLMQPDGIHPNGQGNTIVARDVFQFIQPLLTK